MTIEYIQGTTKDFVILPLTIWITFPRFILSNLFWVPLELIVNIAHTVCARECGLYKVKNECQQTQKRANKVKTHAAIHKCKWANGLGPKIFGGLSNEAFRTQQRKEKKISVYGGCLFMKVTISAYKTSNVFQPYLRKIASLCCEWQTPQPSTTRDSDIRTCRASTPTSSTARCLTCNATPPTAPSARSTSATRWPSPPIKL